RGARCELRDRFRRASAARGRARRRGRGSGASRPCEPLRCARNEPERRFDRAFSRQGGDRQRHLGRMSVFELEPIEKAPREELARLQLERLQWTLKHAYENVPHYRRKFDAADVKPGDCKRLEDLRRFPFTTKADLRETYP